MDLPLISMRPGDPCPACGSPMVEWPGMFYWRDTFKPGVVCGRCKALWPKEGEEIEPLRPPGPRVDPIK